MRLSFSVTLILLAAACGRVAAEGEPEIMVGGGAGKSGEVVAAGAMASAAAGNASSAGTGNGGDGSAGAGAAPVAMGGASVGGQTGLAGSPEQPPEGGSNAGGGAPPSEFYSPRSGPFKMVVYSKTEQYRHSGSIESGTATLQEIADNVGATVLFTEDNAFIEHLDDYELLFFLNTSGGVFDAAEKTKLEAWMLKGGAFCGTHSAAETEYGWPFYRLIIGQNDEGHGYAGTADSLVLNDTALDHPAIRGLPNPWPRVDEWLQFKTEDKWSHEPGFKILARKGSDELPISWVREYGGYRSFYTGIGHDRVVFEEPLVKKHLTGGIMWTVRREHCLTTPKPASCP